MRFYIAILNIFIGYQDVHDQGCIYKVSEFFRAVNSEADVQRSKKDLVKIDCHYIDIPENLMRILLKTKLNNILNTSKWVVRVKYGYEV